MTMSYDEYCDATFALANWFKSQGISEVDSCIMMAALSSAVIRMMVLPENQQEAAESFIEMVRTAMASRDVRMTKQ